MATATQSKRQMSPAARQQLVERNQARAAEMRAARAAREADGPAIGLIAAPAPAQEGDVLASQDDVFQQLVSLAQAAGGVAKKKQDRAAILDQVAELLNKLDTTAYAELLERPEVEALVGAVVQSKIADPGLKPGEDLGPAIGKKPWTIQDYQRLADSGVPGTRPVEVNPRDTVPVTINGVTIMFREDEPITVPECFRDVYDQHRRAPRLAKEHIDYMFRKTDQVSDPTILSDGSRRVRGRYSGGLAGVGTGLALAVPDADRPGIDEIGGTEVGEEIGEPA